MGDQGCGHPILINMQCDKIVYIQPLVSAYGTEVMICCAIQTVPGSNLLERFQHLDQNLRAGDPSFHLLCGSPGTLSFEGVPTWSLGLTFYALPKLFLPPVSWTMAPEAAF